DKRKILTEIKKEIKNAEEIYLATDPDREGEAICWHIAKEVERTAKKQGEKKIHRVLFNEITKTAVLKGIEEPKEIDINLVNSQQARRVLDRLVGYSISPLLWKAIRKGLSAGRVQSVALRLIVERQKEIDGFNPVEYWSVKAVLSKTDEIAFEAKLTEKAGEKPVLNNKEDADAALKALEGAEYTVSDVVKKERRRKALPPFITSTLQQEAARRFKFTAQKTMMLAQQLYEGLNVEGEGQVGLITYMRTDSLRISEDARAEAVDYIRQKMGEEYLPEQPNVYKSKKSSQDAHEAIRPTSAFRNLEKTKSSLDNDQYKIYSLIWRRFMASQMTPAVFDDTRVKISAADCIFSANGSIRKFDGFLRVYDLLNAKTDEPEKESTLPEINVRDRLNLNELVPEQHFTQPPPYYTDATLVKALEEKDIGRPSTYAPIISTLVYRKYIEREGGRFIPTELGSLVAEILIKNFSDIINEKFTARMEDNLDSIEEGKIEWKSLIRKFYGELMELIKKAEPHMEEIKKEIEGDITEECEKCGGRMVVKWGRYGKFLSCEKYPDCKSAKPLEENREKHTIEEPCPDCGKELMIKQGPFGSFVACSTYPECKYTRQIVIKAGVNCPDCGGDIIERTFKRFRKFYGCSSYPKCKFMIWDKPIDKKCPKCDAPFLLEKWKRNTVAVYCNKCDYRAEEDKAQDE
ncbi:MAG TPA: type I DNA topoisomerase, partial [Firmicutes bacterium]|nr:type I DNA topoisomerase [Bacillota bacterium]